MIEMELDKWQKPYNWMVNDLQNSLGAGANYLVALGLFCYIEVLGKKVLSFRESGINFYQQKYNKKAFNLFLGEYMGYQEILDANKNKVYDWFRNGLTHQYFIEGYASGVFLYFDEESIDFFNKQGIDTTKGIVIKGGNHVVLLNILLDDFKKGIKLFLKESNKF